MRTIITTYRILACALFLVICVSLTAAQRRPTPPPKKPAAPAAVPEVPLTFDTILGEETYRIYSEVRNVGQVIRSPAVNDVLKPVLKMAKPPKEINTILNWVGAHGDALANSRMFVATWPVKPEFPDVVIAVEFSSPEEATKFESELRGFVPSIFKPPVTSPDALAISPTSPPPYHIKQSGQLVLLTDKPFSAATLKPRRKRLLAEDPNFTVARNRFASESIFLYVDVKSIEKEQAEQRRKWEAEEKQREKENNNAPPNRSTMRDMEPLVMPPDDRTVSIGSSVTISEPPPPPPPVSAPPTTSDQTTRTATLSSVDTSLFSLYGALFSGPTKWPEAIGIALAIEDNSYTVRALMVNATDSKSSPLPFVPHLFSGPALSPAAPTILPADVDLFFSVSLDYPQIYESILKAFSGQAARHVRFAGPNAPDTPGTAPFAAYEKMLGLSIKDELLPLLGNELAFAFPKKPTTTDKQDNEAPDQKGTDTGNKPGPESGPMPVIAISVKDRESVKRVIAKVIESVGFKGASALAQTERREDTEIFSFANAVSYAFIGDFLVMSNDPAATHHVVDSYLKHETLSSNVDFKNATSWQARQVQAQVYMSPAVIDLYRPFGPGMSHDINEKLKELLGETNPIIEPLTYSLNNEGLGPLHELHLPKSLLMFAIAGMSTQVKESPIGTNESIAQSLLRTVASAQTTFRAGKGDGRYGTLDELTSEGLLSKDLMERYGYRFEMVVFVNKFEATAVPIEYGKTGRRSFFIDESGLLRGGDHGGGPATVADDPVN